MNSLGVRFSDGVSTITDKPSSPSCPIARYRLKFAYAFDIFSLFPKSSTLSRNLHPQARPAKPTHRSAYPQHPRLGARPPPHHGRHALRRRRGMIMKPEPVFAAVEGVLGAPPACPVILLCPQGRLSPSSWLSTWPPTTISRSSAGGTALTNASANTLPRMSSPSGISS